MAEMSALVPYLCSAILMDLVQDIFYRPRWVEVLFQSSNDRMAAQCPLRMLAVSRKCVILPK